MSFSKEVEALHILIDQILKERQRFCPRQPIY